MQVEEFLRNVILELKDVDEDRLVPELVIDSLALDSLDFVEIQLGIKKAYNVSVEPEVFAQGTVRTLGDLIGLIQRRAAQATAT
jgi:acyl carrier protein